MNQPTPPGPPGAPELSVGGGPSELPEARGLLALGVVGILLAVLLNESVLRDFLSRDGTLEGSTRWLVRLGQGTLVLGCLALIGLRRRLAPAAAALAPFQRGWITIRGLLVLAIALRIAVFVVLRPQNNDPHWDFVRFIAENYRLPIATELFLGFQAPLYYVLAAPWSLGESMKVTQAFSLLLSVVNIALIAHVVRTTPLLSSVSARCHAFVFAAILPQFVLFSSFVSNDALAFPLGTLVVILAFRYIGEPSRRHLVQLAGVQGLALLTKGTLIGNVPVFLLVVAVTEWRKPGSLVERARPVILFGALTALIGSYKFIENTVHFGTPVVGNDILKQEWVDGQTGTYQGPSSLYDVNVLKLVEFPRRSEVTQHSIPLLMYGTFWGPYINESNFEATRRFPLDVVPRGLFLVGVVPSLLILLGLGAWTWRARTLLGDVRVPDADADDRVHRNLEALVIVLLLAGAVALVLKWGLKHDAWSFFQARLCFPAFLSIALGFGFGYELLERRGATARMLLNAALVLLYAIIGIYYGVELTQQFVSA